jgi:CDP-glucose 4,6-dehydratase
MRLPETKFWHDKRVLVTGHLGFKGSWMSAWLCRLGAQVHGLDKNPDVSSSLATLAALDLTTSHTVNVADPKAVLDAFAAISPEIVIHMAAQPLVRPSYANPALTFLENVQGTVNVLEAVRQGDAAVCICVTSDKVYRNREWLRPYSEDDALGGDDPYSASKAACDIAVQSYAASFFSARAGSRRHPARIASVRAGNVIGGGDWAADRLLPDAANALGAGDKPRIRNPDAIRPWQHVLDPIAGYLLLAEFAWERESLPCTAWNFGPDPAEALTVRAVMDRVVAAWGDRASYEIVETRDAPHEAGRLMVDSSRAQHHLGWRPRWNADDAIEKTVRWYRGLHAGASAATLVNRDLDAYLGT